MGETINDSIDNMCPIAWEYRSKKTGDVLMVHQCSKIKDHQDKIHVCLCGVERRE